ncbi:MAG: HAMP domain-containing histidine kinase [Microcoleus sp. SIO2G3]|nr:HAMP domain-containing histidine kinase [Microcoleus sp. SIO2G3]
MMPKSKNIPWQHQLQATLDDWSSLPMWLWVKQANSEMIISQNMSSMPASQKAMLMSLQTLSVQNSRYKVAGQQLIVKATPLPMVNQPAAMLYIADDITEMLSRSQAAIRNLAIALILFFPVLSFTITVIVRRSLLPLLQINRWITLNDTTQPVPVNLQRLPREVQQLVISCHQLSTSLFATKERQRQFTNQVSHDLRTPLSIVYGYLQSLLRRGTNLTIPQREALETATAETEHIIEILQDLLNQVRADDTVLSVPPKSTDTKLQSSQLL